MVPLSCSHGIFFLVVEHSPLAHSLSPSLDVMYPIVTATTYTCTASLKRENRTPSSPATSCLRVEPAGTLRGSFVGARHPSSRVATEFQTLLFLDAYRITYGPEWVQKVFLERLLTFSSQPLAHCFRRTLKKPKPCRTINKKLEPKNMLSSGALCRCGPYWARQQRCWKRLGVGRRQDDGSVETTCSRTG